MTPTSSAPLTIAGLGPGNPGLLTIEARDLFGGADEVWLRTSRHPTVASLPQGPRYESFDAEYDAAATFDEVYARIAERVLALARRPEGVIYAVPGHPLFGEATVQRLLGDAQDAGIAVRIVAGVSFVDALAAELAIDPAADGLLLLDALQLGDHRRLLAPQRPTIIAQVYNQQSASQAKLALLDVYPPEHPVTVVSAAGEASVMRSDVPLRALDHDAGMYTHLTSLYLPPLSLVDDIRTFEGLRAVVARLRSPDGGCPWDLEQTHESLKRFLLEEAYEALDALDGGEPATMAEELGDLLMQVLLHAQLGEDEGTFVIEDVLASIAAKLIRRHPHVFGDVEVDGAGEVLRNWETLKKAERGDAPLLDAVPLAMPALAQAQSVQGRATKAGLGDAPTAGAALAALFASTAGGTATLESMGEMLFGIVGLARAQDLDAEESLRLAVRRFRDAVNRQEAAARTDA